MISFNQQIILITIFSLSICFSVQATVTLDIQNYFITIRAPKPSEYDVERFWEGLYEDGCLPSSFGYSMRTNRIINETKTPLQIALDVKAQDWLTFLLESNKFPFTEIVALRKKIVDACSTNTIPNFTERDILNINQPLNADGDTTIILAARANHRSLVEQLKALGAHETQENIAGENAQELMVTIENVTYYFTKSIPQPDIGNYMWLWAGIYDFTESGQPNTGNYMCSWAGSDDGTGKDPVEFVIIKNTLLKGGKTPLQIAVDVKSQAWLTFLLESNELPFTEIVALREKILNAGNAETELEFTKADRRHINQPLNENGDTAIILAVSMGLSDNFVKQLQELGADPAQKNITGQCALDVMNTEQ